MDLPFCLEAKATNIEKQVSILTQGSGGIFEMTRKKIAPVLMSGQSCMVFNIRGTGRSQGIPDEQKTYRDIEAVCQFLNFKGFSDHQINVNGYCLGSGLAVDLASRRPVHLILDRPFAKIGDVMSSIVKQASHPFHRGNLDSVIDYTIPAGANWWVMSYDNVAKLPYVRGSICLIESGKDELIPFTSREKIKAIVAKMPNSMIRSSREFGHTDLFWDEETDAVFLNHLSDHRISRMHMLTPLPPQFAHLRARKNKRSLLNIGQKIEDMTLQSGAPKVGATRV
ncbi:MAG TPA: alpha/beta fold hydrolase [Chlamydiales bacterium]|nr:alpha/beta fold hydrolase [Chlamydiales bacterium]